MSKLRKFVACVLAMFVMVFFVGCTNDSSSSNSQNNNNSNSDQIYEDYDIIGDEDAKIYLKKSTDLIFSYINKINSRLENGIVTVQEFSPVADLVEVILNKVLIVNNERLIYEDINNGLITETVYAKISKAGSKVSSNFARLAVQSNGKGITFSLVTENASDELCMLKFDVKIKNQEIESISFKCAETQENSDNFNLYGFTLNNEDNALNLFFGQPETENLELIDFIWSELETDLSNIYWGSLMACSFNFSNIGAVLPFISTGKQFHKKTSVYPRFEQYIKSAKFNECCLEYMDFDALYDNKKVIDNEKSRLLFENLLSKNIVYDTTEKIFKVV